MAQCLGKLSKDVDIFLSKMERSFRENVRIVHTPHQIFSISESFTYKDPKDAKEYKEISSLGDPSAGLSLTPHKPLKRWMPCFHTQSLLIMKLSLATVIGLIFCSYAAPSRTIADKEALIAREVIANSGPWSFPTQKHVNHSKGVWW